MAGRPRKTKEEKLAKGTANPTRERMRSEPSYSMRLATLNEETGAVTIPVAPSELSDEAKVIWDRAGYQLASMNLFADTVYEYLFLYCQNYDAARIAWAEYGMRTTLMNDKGEVKVNPAWKVYKEAVAQMVVLGGKLGFTPADKTKINSQIAAPTTKDKNKIKRIGVNG
jgi:P27 family predicted phage terminase small subunit